MSVPEPNLGGLSPFPVVVTFVQPGQVWIDLVSWRKARVAAVVQVAKGRLAARLERETGNPSTCRLDRDGAGFGRYRLVEDPNDYRAAAYVVGSRSAPLDASPWGSYRDAQAAARRLPDLDGTRRVAVVIQRRPATD